VTIGFFLVDTGAVEVSYGVIGAGALIRSARRVMPSVEIVQMTDETTALVDGVDRVIRLPREPLALMRLRHQSLVDGEWLFVDTDVVFQRDVRKVFEGQFDIAVTTRNWTHVRNIESFASRMPYNTGVVFSRSQKFWRSAVAGVGKMSDTLQAWMGDQQAICDLITARRSKWKIAMLKGTRYNFPPSLKSSPEADEAQRGASILHFKGVERKTALLEWVRREGLCG